MNTPQMSTAAIVDALGQLKTQQSDLAKVEKKLKDAIAKRMGRLDTNALDGDLFRVVMVTAQRESLDTAEIKRLLVDPPMKTTTAVSYRVNALRKDA
jgi:hypothetical protein